MTEPSTSALPTSPWLAVSRLRPNAAVRLFCLPYAGAGASVFRLWGDLLPRIDVVPVQLPGRESRIRESPVVDLDELVGGVLPYTDRPYAIFGHSFGARLGFELCRALVERGAPDPAWLFVSGFHAPQLPRLAPPASLLPEKEFIQRVARLGGTPVEVWEDPEMRALALPALRADLAYADQYVYAERPPLRCPITVFAGDADTETRLDDLYAWSEHTSAAFAARALPGDHFFLHSARAQLLASIAGDLASGPVPTARISVPVLEAGEVHVWHARTDELAICDARLRAGLSAEELDRADRFRFRRDASRFVRRRWLLRRLLAAYGAGPGTAALATGPHGKPTAPGGSSLRFNASSSGGLAVVALARDREVGIDVERVRVVADRALLVRSTMTGEEQAVLAGGGGDSHDGAFLRLWTVKEAFMKALGTGLSLEPLHVVTKPVGPGRWTVSSSRDVRLCTAVAVDVGPSHIASLAFPEGAQPRLRTLALTPGRLS